MNSSEFASWFEAQYGPEPPCPSHEEQMRINHEFNEAKTAVRRAAEYRAKRSAALTAWQAARNPNPEAWK